MDTKSPSRRAFPALLAGCLACLFTVTPLLAQKTAAFDEIDFLTRFTGVGVRSQGMGGTGLATAQDFSAVTLNPAGLAFAKTPSMDLGLSSLHASTDANFLGNLTQGKQNLTRFHNLGVVYPVPVYRGAMTLAAGFARIHDFNSVLVYEGFNNGVDDMVFQREDISEEGALNLLTVAGALEIAPKVSVGLALNYWFGDHQYNSIFDESDTENQYTFADSRTDQFINSDMRGFDVKLGLQVRPNRYFSFGATIGFPRTLWVEESFAEDFELVFDADQNLAPEFDASDGFFEYRVRLPFTFGVGGALTHSGLTLAADLEYIDWSQTRYLTDTPLEGLTRSAANLDIKRSLNGSLARKFGGEFVMAPYAVAIRGGYAEVPSPYGFATRDEMQRTFSVGLGVPLGRTAQFDVGVAHSWWQQSSVGSVTDIVIFEDRVDDRVFVSLAFNF